MSSFNRLRRTTPNFRVILGCWLLMALFLILLQTLSDFWIDGELKDARDYLRFLISEIGYAFIWAIMTPVIFRVSWARLTGKISRYAEIGAHATLFTCLMLLRVIKDLALILLLEPDVILSSIVFQPFLLNWIELQVLIYIVVMLIAYGFHYYLRFRKQELIERRLERQVLMSEFDGIKMQTQPDFLVKTLHQTSTMLQTSVDDAEQMLTNLSGFLRSTLLHSNHEQISLEDELDLFEDYLEIQRKAHPGFSFKLSIDLEAWGHSVPSMILLPLAEILIPNPNEAIAHLIIDTRDAEGMLTISLVCEPNSIESLKTEFQDANLERLRRRLRRLYNGLHVMTLHHDGGVLHTIRLMLPLTDMTEPQLDYKVF